MKKVFLPLAIFLLLQVSGNTQKNTKQKFTSINEFGMVWGAANNALQLQTINGLSHKTFFAGIGVGLDYYSKRTVPLFMDLRKDIFSKKQIPFVYANIGVDMPWVKADESNTWYKSNYHHGGYYGIGIGYKVPISKKLFANMSFGYTQKSLKEERINQMVVFDFSPYSSRNGEYYNYTFRRFSLKAGLSF
jgi:hypothetical protein